MPRAKKPHGRTVDRRNGATLALVAQPPPALCPDPPAGLLAATKTAWRAFWASQPARLVDSGDFTALSRLFSLYDERERAYRAFRRKRLTTGSTGQLVVNPLGKQLLAYDAAITQLEDRFGLTPMARLKLGVTFGEAARSLESLNEELAADDDDDPRADDPDQDAAAGPDARAMGVPLD